MNELLRPPSERPMPAEARAEIRRHLLDEVVGGRARQASRRRLPVLIAAALLVTGSVGAWAAIRSVSFTQAPEYAVTDVACYQGPTLESDISLTKNLLGEDPAYLCAGADPALDGPGNAQAWTPCSFTDHVAGPVGVFPTSDRQICRDLGLRPLAAGYQQQTHRFIALDEALKSRVLNEDSCPESGAVESLMRPILDEHGFSNWTVDVVAQRDGYDYTSVPCAYLGFDLDTNTVIVEPGRGMGT